MKPYIEITTELLNEPEVMTEVINAGYKLSNGRLNPGNIGVMTFDVEAPDIPKGATGQYTIHFESYSDGTTNIRSVPVSTLSSLSSPQ